MAAKKDDYSWVGWAAGMGLLWWFISRSQPDLPGETTAAGTQEIQHLADQQDIVADDLLSAPIERDELRPGPDGIRNPPTTTELYPSTDIYEVEETGGSGEAQEYYEIDFGRGFNPL